MDIIFAQKIVFYEIKKKNWKERTRGKIIKNINIRFNKKIIQKEKFKRWNVCSKNCFCQIKIRFEWKKKEMPSRKYNICAENFLLPN